MILLRLYLYLALSWFSCTALHGQAIDWIATDEEFVGPLPGWKDLRADFGAIGDGVADDTAAVQAALDSFRDMPACSASVLYVPAGTYRITASLRTTRKDHNDYLGFEWIGEDPAKTRFVWDGARDGTMVLLDQWFGKVSRLSFDGRSRAAQGIHRDGAFSTYGEISDCFFQDMGRALQFGGGASDTGQAETMVRRCRFSRISDVAVATSNFNSLDIWLWYNLFQDCRYGAFSFAGNYHAYHNVFLRSTVADLAGTSFLYAFVGNVSVGSRRFIDWQTGFATPFAIPLLARGNRVYDFTGDYAVALNNVGPYTLLDNVIKNRAGDDSTSICLGSGANLLVGNSFSVAKALQRNGAATRELDSKFDPELATPASLPLPRTPPRVTRLRFPVAIDTGDDAAALQAAIDAAAVSKDPRPVVHIPKGTLKLGRSVVLPANRTLQLIGDGASQNGSVLGWSGPPREGPLLLLRGPSRATLRDLYLSAGGNADALWITRADQAGGRIYGEQLHAGDYLSGGTSVGGVEQSDITLPAYQGGPVSVRGGTLLRTGKPAPGQISLFGGAGGNASPAYRVQDGGRLLSEAVYHEFVGGTAANLTALDLDASQRGELTIAMAKLAYRSAPSQPLVRVHDYSGKLLLLGNNYHAPASFEDARSHWLDIRGDKPSTRVLVLGGFFDTQTAAGSRRLQGADLFRDTSSPALDAALYQSIGNDSAGAYALGDVVKQQVSRATGVFGTIAQFPTQSFQNSNYYRDLVFVADSSATRHSLFANPAPPETPSDGVAYELGLRVRIGRPGKIHAIRYFRPAQESGSHTGRVWDESGELLAQVDFNDETPEGWQSATLPEPLPVKAGTYVITVNANSHYACDAGAFDRGVVSNGPLASSPSIVPSDVDLRASLHQIRGARNEPPVARPAGATDVKLHRIYMDSTAGRAALRIFADDESP